MVATAERIDFISHNIVFEQGSPGPIPIAGRSTLTVNFRVFRRGPAHVSGLIYTTNFWIRPQTALAQFQSFEGDNELWRAIVIESSNAFNQRVSFEYVIFCDDHRGNSEVEKIYNTNNGETFRIQ